MMDIQQQQFYRSLNGQPSYNYPGRGGQNVQDCNLRYRKPLKQFYEVDEQCYLNSLINNYQQSFFGLKFFCEGNRTEVNNGILRSLNGYHYNKVQELVHNLRNTLVRKPDTALTGINFEANHGNRHLEMPRNYYQSSSESDYSTYAGDEPDNYFRRATTNQVSNYAPKMRPRFATQNFDYAGQQSTSNVNGIVASGGDYIDAASNEGAILPPVFQMNHHQPSAVPMSNYYNGAAYVCPAPSALSNPVNVYQPYNEMAQNSAVIGGGPVYYPAPFLSPNAGEAAPQPAPSYQYAAAPTWAPHIFYNAAANSNVETAAPVSYYGNSNVAPNAPPYLTNPSEWSSSRPVEEGEHMQMDQSSTNPPRSSLVPVVEEDERMQVDQSLTNSRSSLMPVEEDGEQMQIDQSLTNSRLSLMPVDEGEQMQIDSPVKCVEQVERTQIGEAEVVSHILNGGGHSSNTSPNQDYNMTAQKLVVAPVESAANSSVTPKETTTSSAVDCKVNTPFPWNLNAKSFVLNRPTTSTPVLTSNNGGDNWPMEILSSPVHNKIMTNDDSEYKNRCLQKEEALPDLKRDEPKEEIAADQLTLASIKRRFSQVHATAPGTLLRPPKSYKDALTGDRTHDDHGNSGNCGGGGNDVNSNKRRRNHRSVNNMGTRRAERTPEAVSKNKWNLNATPSGDPKPPPSLAPSKSSNSRVATSKSTTFRGGNGGGGGGGGHFATRQKFQDYCCKEKGTKAERN